MIEKAEFRNFKALRNVSVGLERFRVLVGPNASGKTSVLEGLCCISQLRDKAPQEVFSGKWAPELLRTSSATEPLQLYASGNAGGHEYVVVKMSPEHCCIDDNQGHHVSFQTEHWGKGEHKSIQTPATNVFGPGILLRLDANRLAEPSYSDEAVPQIESDGSGLPSVLAYLAANRPDDYAQLIAELREVVPIVRAMRFPRALVVRSETEVITVDGKEFTRQADREYWGNSIEFDIDGATGIPGHMISEGTLRVLGLLAVLIWPNRPRLALLDDLDRALHPKAQQALVKCLRGFMDQDPELQIIATSHSPYLLHYLEPQEVRLMTTDEGGFAACGRLDQHPDFEKWKEEMSPGEMWSLFGESWLVPSATGGPQS